MWLKLTLNLDNTNFKKCLLALSLLFTFKSFSQKLNYESELNKAIAHRQMQNAANVIEWDKDLFLLNIDSQYIDQKKGLLIITSGRYLVHYHIKILGTYYFPDSSFLWSNFDNSIDSSLTRPVTKLFSIALKNDWQLQRTRIIGGDFLKLYNMVTLAAYLDNANGIKYITSSDHKTSLYFSFYEVEIYSRATKALLKRIPVRKRYQSIDAPALIEHCRKYVAEFGENESRYTSLYQNHQEDEKYLDTMLINRVKISDKYWDTTSTQYETFRQNRLQAHYSIDNWRVVLINDVKYVLYDETYPWSAIYTWAFKICEAGGVAKVCDEYLCF